MTLYKISIQPQSNFATTLKGDTLFGQLCWLIFHQYSESYLVNLLKDYTNNKPFMIVSDAFVGGYLSKPTIPSVYLNEDSDNKKMNRKKAWMTLDDLQSGYYCTAKSDDEVVQYLIKQELRQYKDKSEQELKKIEQDLRELIHKDKSETIIRNSINYKSFTTGANSFDPYGVEENQYYRSRRSKIALIPMA